MELLSPIMVRLLKAVRFSDRLKRLAEGYREAPTSSKEIDWSLLDEPWGDCENRCCRPFCMRPGTMKDKQNRWICKYHHYKSKILKKKKLEEGRIKRSRKNYKKKKALKKIHRAAGKKAWRTRLARMEANKKQKNKAGHIPRAPRGSRAG